MKASRVVSLKKLGFINYILKNRIILILCILFTVGIAIGVFGYSSAETPKQIADNSISSFLQNRQGKSFIRMFLASFMTEMLLVIICFLCGASLMGVATVPIFISVCGFFYGNFSTFLFLNYALKGIAFNAVLLLPPTLILFIGLTFAAQESILFSLQLAKTTLPKNRPVNLSLEFKNYCGKYLLICCVVLFSSLCDSLLSKTLMAYFDF